MSGGELISVKLTSKKKSILPVTAIHRGCHLMPLVRFGGCDDDAGGWKRYDVNNFVDTEMFMSFY